LPNATICNTSFANCATPNILHEPTLAPTKEILDAYKSKHIAWEQYETRYLDLLVARAAEQIVDRKLFDVPTVLLCSESSPQHCHRRLAAEYLADQWAEERLFTCEGIPLPCDC